MFLPTATQTHAGISQGSPISSSVLGVGADHPSLLQLTKSQRKRKGKRERERESLPCSLAFPLTELNSQDCHSQLQASTSDLQKLRSFGQTITCGSSPRGAVQVQCTLFQDTCPGQTQADLINLITCRLRIWWTTTFLTP